MHKLFSYEILGLALTAILLTTGTVNAGDGTSSKDDFQYSGPGDETCRSERTMNDGVNVFCVVGVKPSQDYLDRVEKNCLNREPKVPGGCAVSVH